MGGERGDYFGGGEEGFEVEEEGGVLLDEMVSRDVLDLVVEWIVPLILVVCSRFRRASSLLILLRRPSREHLLFGSCCHSLDRS